MTVDFTEKVGEAPSVDLTETITGALSADRKEISCLQRLIIEFIDETRQALSALINDIYDKTCKIEADDPLKLEVSASCPLRCINSASASTMPTLGPAIRRLLATRIDRYVSDLRDNETFPSSLAVPPEITKDDVILALKACLEQPRRSRGCFISWAVLRRAVGSSLLDHKGTVPGTVASDITYDDIADLLPKELCEKHFSTPTSKNGTKKTTKMDIVETAHELLFARAALDRYSTNDDIVKAMACLSGKYRDYMAKAKYEDLHSRLIKSTVLVEVWFLDNQEIAKRISRQAKVGIRYNEASPADDVSMDTFIHSFRADSDSDVDAIDLWNIRKKLTAAERELRKLGPTEAVQLLKSAELPHLQKEGLLLQLESFNRYVRGPPSDTTRQALALYPAIVSLARLGAYLTTDDTTSTDEGSVEDMLTLLPGQSLTAAAFHQVVSSAISLTQTSDVSILPTSLVE